MRALPAFALLLSLCTVPAAAQPVLPLFHVNTGATFPIGPHSFSGSHGIGYGLALGAGVNILDRADIYAEGSFTAFPADLGYLEADEVNVTGGEITLTGAALGARLRFPTSSGAVYLSPRGGFDHYVLDDNTLQFADTTIFETGTSEWAPTFSLGAGVTFDFLPQVALFVEADYALVFAEDRTLRYAPVRVGVILRPGREE